MQKLMERALRAARKFTILDYTFFKLALVSFGILLGSYFAAFFSDHRSLLWIVFIVSYLIMLFRMFLVHKF